MITYWYKHAGNYICQMSMYSLPSLIWGQRWQNKDVEQVMVRPFPQVFVSVFSATSLPVPWGHLQQELLKVMQHHRL